MSARIGSISTRWLCWRTNSKGWDTGISVEWDIARHPLFRSDGRKFIKARTCKVKKSLMTGFEPARAGPNGFQVHPLNHSGTSTISAKSHVA